MTLDANGELEDYRDGSRELAASSIGPDPTLSDEKAESLAWTTARTVGASSSLRVTRVERSLEPGVVRVVLLPKVNGYVAVGADSLECRFLSTTGALISLRVRRGWSYETPRIAVSREAAIATANQRFGSGGLWECELEYVAVGNDGAPTELRKMYAGKTARLCYVLFRESDQQRLLVDSTNGAILAVGRLSTADALGLPSGGGEVVYANKFGRFVKTAGVADWWRTLVTLGLAVGAAGLTAFLAMRTYRRMKQSA